MGYWLLATGYWLMANGYWQLVSGCLHEPIDFDWKIASLRQTE
jgi:hypothetical protein